MHVRKRDDVQQPQKASGKGRRWGGQVNEKSEVEKSKVKESSKRIVERVDYKQR